MARKHKLEEIIGKLREAEIVLAQAERWRTHAAGSVSSSRATTAGARNSPWENGYCESFNGSMRDELLNGEIFHTLAEAQIQIEA